MEENKKTNHKGFKIFIIIFLLSSFFLLREGNQNKLINLFGSIVKSEKVLTLNSTFKHDGDIEEINLYDDNIVKWSHNKISFLKADGSIILEKQFNFQDPGIYYGENNIYVTDKSTGDIYTFNRKGDTIDKIKLDKEIFNINESYNNLIYHIKNNNIESLSIYNQGKVLIGNHSYENKNILTSTTNEDGTINTISLLNLEDGIVKSRIESYKDDNSKLNSLDLEGEIVVFLKHTKDNNLIALTDRSLYRIKNGKIMWKKQYNLIKDIYISNDNVFLLYSNYLETIDYEGRTKNKIGFNEEYNKILPLNNDMVLYNDNSIVVINGEEEILKHNDSIIAVFSSKDNLLIWGTEDIKTYKITNKR